MSRWFYLVDELSITYRLNYKDLWNLFRYKNSLLGNKYVNLIISLGIPLLLALSLLGRDSENIVSIFIYLLIYIVVFIPITVIIRVIIIITRFSLLVKRKKESLKGITLTLSEKGITEGRGPNPQFTPWKDIDGVDSKENYFLIHIENNEPYVISKRYFKTSAQWNEFVNFAFTYWSHDQTGKRIR